MDHQSALWSAPQVPDHRGEVPGVTNPSFEEGMAGWEVQNGAEFVLVE